MTPFHRYKYEEHNGQIPLIIHHNEKKNQKYISDVKEQDCWASHKIESGCKEKS